MTVKEFSKSYPDGRYIIVMDGHWSACVNGCIYDTWDCSELQMDFAYLIQTEGYKHPNLKNQIFRYCCISEKISSTETAIRIYDGNGSFTERIIPTNLAEGYVRCLEDSNYQHIKL